METSNENKNARPFSDVRFAERRSPKIWSGFLRRGRKTVNLRPAFYRRYPLVAVFILLLAVLSVFGAKKLLTRAEVADFYPSTCLGSWAGAQNAQGKPEMLAPAASSTFNGDNSAVFNSGAGQIFCGGFLPQDYTASGDIKSVGLTFVWQIGEPTATSSFPQGAQVATSTAASAAEATSTEESAQNPVQPAGSSSGTSAAAASGSGAANTSTVPQTEATSTPPANATSSASFLYDFRSLFFNLAFAETASDATSSANDATASASVTPPPPAPQPANETTTPSSTNQGAQNPEQAASSTAENASSSQAVIVGPPLQATLAPVASSTEEATNTGQGTPGAEQATQIVPPAPDENFLKISYSTDGQTWIEIAKVNESNWQNFTVTLPIVSWDLLKKLQIQVEGVPTTLNPTPKVYLDGMFAEVHYDLPPVFAGVSGGGAPQTAGNPVGVAAGTPIIVLPPSQKPLPASGNPEQSTFKASEAPQFNLDLNSLAAPTSTPAP